MRAKRFAITLVVAGLWAAVGLPLRAEDKENAALLANSLSQASVSLAQALKASEPEGKPISGKFEIEDGALQLSVYTTKGGKFSEVVVDHKSGSIAKAEAITDADDLKEAAVQSLAMTKAKVSLEKAVRDAVAANPGYRATSVAPMTKSGSPMAEVTLIKGVELKKFLKKLD